MAERRAQQFDDTPGDEMRKGKVLVTVDWLHSVPGPAGRMRQRIEAAGYEVVLSRTKSRLSAAELMPLLVGVVGHLAGNDELNATVIETARELRIISRQGAGFDNVDLEAATKRGIVVCNAVGAGASAVAEFAFAMMLAIGRRLVPAQTALREGRWLERTDLGGVSPIGATLGVIGLGNIGRSLVELVRGFKMRILYFDRERQQHFEEESGIKYAHLDELLRESDFVSIHVSLNFETHHLIGERELALMKPTAYLINTSRGSVVDEEALYRALLDGRIAGAGLDVFEQEPVAPNNHLLTLPDTTVLLTNHVAVLSDKVKAALLELATDNLLDALQGRRPRFVTNPDVYTVRS